MDFSMLQWLTHTTHSAQGAQLSVIFLLCWSWWRMHTHALTCAQHVSAQQVLTPMHRSPQSAETHPGCLYTSGLQSVSPFLCHSYLEQRRHLVQVTSKSIYQPQKKSRFEQASYRFIDISPWTGDLVKLTCLGICKLLVNASDSNSKDEERGCCRGCTDKMFLLLLRGQRWKEYWDPMMYNYVKYSKVYNIIVEKYTLQVQSESTFCCEGCNPEVPLYHCRWSR